MFSKARGIVKYVLLGIARRMVLLGNSFGTPRGLPASTLASDLGLHRDTVQGATQAIDTELGDEVEVIKPRRRGEPYRYRLRLQARLPLDPASSGGEGCGEAIHDAR